MLGVGKMMQPISMVFFGAFGIIIWVGFTFLLWMSRVRQVGPNEVLIVAGRPFAFQDAEGRQRQVGFRWIKGGRAFIFPIIEKVFKLSLEVMQTRMQIDRILTGDGEKISLEITAQVKIGGSDSQILSAAENLLEKQPAEIIVLAQSILESHFKTEIRNSDFDQISERPMEIFEEVTRMASSDLEKLGIIIVNLHLQDVKKES